MKLIHVYGNTDDYAAEDFTMMNITYEAAYNKAKKCEDDTWEFRKDAFVKAMDFAYVHTTNDFIEFIHEVLGDTDMLNAEDFFIVEN